MSEAGGMITGVCLNPCIDRMIVIDSLVRGGLNRILSSRNDPAGKGYNVARAASRLGLRCAASGFLFDENGDVIADALAADGVEDHCLRLPGRVRVNLKIYEKNAAIVTELNERGEAIGPEAFSALTDALETLAHSSEYMVFSGSAAPGLPTDVYEKLIRLAQSAGCKAVLDADGPLLAQGLKARPFMIKPNRYELELLAGRELGSLQEIRHFCDGLLADGIRVVAVSLGAEGAMIVSEGKAYYAPATDVPVKSTVGAGDSMVAGMLLGLSNHAPADEVLRLGTACAATSVSREGTGLSDAGRLREMAERTTVRPL